MKLIPHFKSTFWRNRNHGWGTIFWRNRKRRSTCSLKVSSCFNMAILMYSLLQLDLTSFSISDLCSFWEGELWTSDTQLTLFCWKLVFRLASLWYDSTTFIYKLYKLKWGKFNERLKTEKLLYRKQGGSMKAWLQWHWDTNTKWWHQLPFSIISLFLCFLSFKNFGPHSTEPQ